MPADGNQTLLYGASAAVWRGRDVLLVKRGRAPYAGKWSLPGGMIEAGETAGDAAMREIREETGVIAEVERQIDTFTIVGSGRDGKGERTYHLSVFAARYVSGTAVAADDAAAAEWVAPERFGEYDLTPQTAEVLAAERLRQGRVPAP